MTTGPSGGSAFLMRMVVAVQAMTCIQPGMLDP